MEKVMPDLLQRHDVVVVSPSAAKRLVQELLPQFNDNRRMMAQPFFQDLGSLPGIPGIVRRAENPSPELIAVGFVPPGRHEGQRLRIGAFVRAEDILSVVHPEDILQMAIAPRNACMLLLRDLAIYSREQDWNLGVLGSAGLEIFTGQPYTDADSDLDLLLPGRSMEKIRQAMQIIGETAAARSVPVDVEVRLSNGYGVKAAELLSSSRMILGKSKQDVALLQRQNVLALIG